MKRLDFPQAMTPYKLLQQSYGARNIQSNRSAGRKMSTPATVTQAITSLPANADGQLSVSLGGRTATNIVTNGNFANGTTGWVAPAGGSISATGNELSSTAVATGTFVFQTLSPTTIAEHLYYGRAKVKTISNLVALRIGTTASFHSGNGLYQTLSVVHKATNPAHSLNVIDNRTSGWDFIKIMEAMAIDLTATFGAGNEPTVAQCNAMFPNWFDGTKSTLSVRARSVGKNLFDKSKARLGGFYNASGAWVSVEGYYSSDYISVNGNTQYTHNRSSATYINYYDAGKTWISSLLTSSFITPYNARYCKVMGASVDKSIDLFQVELGAVTTTYEPYTETTIYLPAIGRSLPNGTKDEFSVSDGKRTQRIKADYVLQASDILAMTTSLTNIDVAQIFISTDHVTWTGNVDGNLSIYGMNQVSFDTRDNASNIGKYYVSVGTQDRIFAVFAKGTTLTQAQASLVGITLTYQLATPVVTQYMGIGQLDALPNGSIIVEPVVRGVKLPAFGTGKIAITDATAPITSIESVYRIDTGLDGMQTKTDVTSLFALDSDKFGITYVSADSTKPHEYVCLLDPACSTLPSLTYSYPEADALALGIVSHSYASAAADWVMTTSESQCGVLVCTLASGAANIIAPDRTGTPYWVQNDSGQTLTVKKSGGTGDTVATGKKALFIHTGVDYVKFFTT